MKRVELVFIPSPFVGHLLPALELAKLMVDRDDGLSVTFLIMKLPFDSMVSTYAESLAAASPTGHIHFVTLPQPNSDFELLSNHGNFLTLFMESQKPLVKAAVNKITQRESDPDSPRLAGFVIDIFCTGMIDVANEFNVSTYVFFTSGAAFLGMIFHLQILQNEHNIDIIELEKSDTELIIPSFLNSVPSKVLPLGIPGLLGHAKRLRESKGIIVNTFMELEPHAVESLCDDSGSNPVIYTAGPLLNLKDEAHMGSSGMHNETEIMAWLDDQPPSSVVFLCFGTLGTFGVNQVKEIAQGLESSGQRFLWSIRRPPPMDKLGFPTDYTNVDEVLPKGFLDRTAEIGRVIGWAQQLAILAHPAIGGFVSHCGWNSILESLWFGVPIAAWPMYAEQQMNAFEMVKELGLGVEIKLDYRRDFRNQNQIVVTAEEIERGVMNLMRRDSVVRKKVKEMKEKSRKALADGGSSYKRLGHLIVDLMMEDK